MISIEGIQSSNNRHAEQSTGGIAALSVRISVCVWTEQIRKERIEWRKRTSALWNLSFAKFKKKTFHFHIAERQSEIKFKYFFVFFFFFSFRNCATDFNTKLYFYFFLEKVFVVEKFSRIHFRWFGSCYFKLRIIQWFFCLLRKTVRQLGKVKTNKTATKSVVQTTQCIYNWSGAEPNNKIICLSLLQLYLLNYSLASLYRARIVLFDDIPNNNLRFLERNHFANTIFKSIDRCFFLFGSDTKQSAVHYDNHLNRDMVEFVAEYARKSNSTEQFVLMNWRGKPFECAVRRWNNQKRTTIDTQFEQLINS